MPPLSAVEHPSCVVAIVGGNQVVCRSDVALNLAIALTRHPASVCVLDTSAAMIGVSALLGHQATWTLEEILTGTKSLEDIMTRTSKGLRIVSGPLGFVSLGDRERSRHIRFLETLHFLDSEFDFLVIDLPAGPPPDALLVMESAHIVTLVLTPEPDSLQEAFALLKALKLRGYRQVVQLIFNDAVDARSSGRTFLEFSRTVEVQLGLQIELLGSVWRAKTEDSVSSLRSAVTILPTSHPANRTYARLAKRLVDVLKLDEGTRPSFFTYWQRRLEQHPGQMAGATTKDEWRRLRLAISELVVQDEDPAAAIVELITTCLDSYQGPLETLITELAGMLLNRQASRLTPDDQEAASAHARGLERQLQRLQILRQSHATQLMAGLLPSIKYAALIDSSDTDL